MSVLDASAVIAWIRSEPGSDLVQAALDAGEAQISSVNLAEVLTYLTRYGQDAQTGQRDLLEAGLRTVPYTADLALQTAVLYPATQQHRLSLGDRACLALALSTQATVLTSDKVWAQLTLDLPITLIR